VAALERRCNSLFATPVEGAEASRLWVRFREHRDSLFVFLYEATVPLSGQPAIQLTVHRTTSGRAATVELVVTDGRGTRPTLVDGGPSAF
jgi:hypothetical protein